MAKKRMPFKLVFRKSSTLTKTALLVALVVCTLTLVGLSAATKNAQQDYEALRQQAADLVAENQQISDRIKSLGSVESIIQIAMEELGLVEPDTIIIEPGN